MKLLKSWGLLVVPLGVAALALWKYWVNFPYLSNKADAWGQFGDYIGGLLNPIIAACTLFVAMRVWDLQEKELKETRAELKSQRDNQYFFNLLNVYHEVTKGLVPPHRKNALQRFRRMHRHEPNGERKHGLDSPQLTAKAVIKQWLMSLECTHQWCQLIEEANVEKLQKVWYESEVGYLLLGYFGAVDSILKTVRSLSTPDNMIEAQRLVEIFRHQLTHDELVLITYFILFDTNAVSLKHSASEYSLLQGLHPDRKREFQLLMPENRKLFVPGSE